MLSVCTEYPDHTNQTFLIFVQMLKRSVTVRSKPRPLCITSLNPAFLFCFCLFSGGGGAGGGAFFVVLLSIMFLFNHLLVAISDIPVTELCELCFRWLWRFIYFTKKLRPNRPSILSVSQTAPKVSPLHTFKLEQTFYSHETKHLTVCVFILHIYCWACVITLGNTFQ